MSRRIRSEDLDQLLNLVEKNRAMGARDDGENILQDHETNLLWSRNHDFWVEQLREETSSAWSDEQYIDAAKLINFAEYQRIALKDFVHVLVDRDLVSDDDTSDDSEYGGPDSADVELSSGADQIQFIGSAGAFAEPAEVIDAAASNEQASAAASAERPDLSAISAVRSRESGNAHFNQIRADLYVQTGLASLRPYTSWDDFQHRNTLPDTLIADLKSAYPDGFGAVDIWVGGLAEVSGLSLEGSTLQAAISTEVGRLHQASVTLGVHELSGSSIFESGHALTYDDIVHRHSGSAHTESIIGPNLNDLAADDSGQILVGSAGDDVIAGGQGDDVISGGAGDDILFGGAGDDEIDGGAGKDTIHGDSGADKIKGGAGQDTLFGDKGNDQLDGQQGRDVAHGGTGDDTITGGADDDQLFGDAGDDIVAGDEGDDGIHGGSGNDQLYGGLGDDVLDGGDGADILAGGLGNDTIYIEDQGDQAVEAAGQGTDTVRTTLNVYVLPENVEVLIYIGDGDFQGTGNDLSNFLSGGQGNDTLQGGAGDDTLAGGSGDDVFIITDAGNLVIEQSGQGTDTVTTTLNGYELGDNVEFLVFVGDGNFTGIGNALDNMISGGQLNDLLDGGTGNDVLNGYNGNDALYGGSGNDSLDGGAGDDTLDGGDGDDVVTGGQGSDCIMFMRGSDTLVLRPGFGNDIVMGFDPTSSGSGGSDRLDVSAYGFTQDAFGVDILLIYDGDSTTVKIGADSVKLFLVDIKTMDRHDFIFS